MPDFCFKRFPKELDKWNKLFLAHSRTRAFQRRVDESKRIIEEALSTFPKWHLSYSGGKDSTAVLGILWEMGLNDRVELFNIYDDRYFTFHIDYIRYMANTYGFKLDARELATDALLQEHLVDEDVMPQLVELAEKRSRAREEKNKESGLFMGLRGQEAKGRWYVMLKTKGLPTIRKSNNTWYCNPIIKWSADDVFAYLLSRNICIIDVYRKLEVINDPRKLRYDNIEPKRFASEGTATWLKVNYQSEFQRLIDAGHTEILKY